ncbi:MAG: glutathione peroxidase [Planctomycetota bacterium]|nr:glutathione peroxidase [Planctomycetota bacterium]
MLPKLTATIAAVVATVTGSACSQTAPQTAELSAKWKGASLHELKVKTLEGKDADLKDYAGKVTLVVNVASQCGLTGQYAGLQKIYDKYKAQGFEILAFPSGDFGGQEFDDPKEIREFCTSRYSVTFPVFEKCRVKTGDGQAEVFAMLGTKTGELPGWNFGKYIVSRDGKTAQFFASTVAPESGRFIDALEKALKEAAPAAPAADAKPAEAPAAEKSAAPAEKSAAPAEKPAAPAKP